MQICSECGAELSPEEIEDETGMCDACFCDEGDDDSDYWEDMDE